MRKADQRELTTILTNLKRAGNYLLDERIAVCTKRTGKPTTTLDAVRLDGTIFYELEKQIGSELCLLFDAIERLRIFLDTH